jgi:hypothetical protein
MLASPLQTESLDEKLTHHRGEMPRICHLTLGTGGERKLQQPDFYPKIYMVDEDRHLP